MYIGGFPSIYRGAEAEFCHQIPIWEKLGITVHFTPTQKKHPGSFLYCEMMERGQWSSEVYDAKAGMVYYNYRHYNPVNGRWIGRDPIGVSRGYNLYDYVHNSTLNQYDRLGLEKTIKTNKENCSIDISLNIVIYPDEGNAIDDSTMQAKTQIIKQSIESNWNGKKKRCCDVNVTANVTPQKRRSRWLYRVFNSDENNIAIKSDAERSYVKGVGGRSGTWGEYADPWVYAHEAGHLMGLPDDYRDVTNPDGTVSSIPNRGHEGHMMGDYGGTVNQDEIDALLNNVECPCDEK